MSAMVSQITGVTITYSTVCSGADQRKHQSCASLTFLRVIHRWPVNSPHKGPVTRKMSSFDNAMIWKMPADLFTINILYTVWLGHKKTAFCRHFKLHLRDEKNSDSHFTDFFPKGLTTNMSVVIEVACSDQSYHPHWLWLSSPGHICVNNINELMIRLYLIHLCWTHIEIKATVSIKPLLIK